MRSPILAAVAIFILAGCAATRIKEEPVRLNLQQPAVIDVDIFAGDVVVDVRERHAEAVVHLTRHAVHGPRRDNEAEASLANIETSVRRVADGATPVIEVRATTTDPEPHFQRVSVRVEMPACSGVIIRTSRGEVSLRDVAGSIEVTTTEGAVSVWTTHALTKPVAVATSDARIDISIPADSTGALDFQTVNGAARIWVPGGATTIDAYTGMDTVRATLNEGENPVILRTTNADIRFRGVDDVVASGNYDG